MVISVLVVYYRKKSLPVHGFEPFTFLTYWRRLVFEPDIHWRDSASFDQTLQLFTRLNHDLKSRGSDQQVNWSNSQNNSNLKKHLRVLFSTSRKFDWSRWKESNRKQIKLHRQQPNEISRSFFFSSAVQDAKAAVISSQVFCQLRRIFFLLWKKWKSRSWNVSDRIFNPPSNIKGFPQKIFDAWSTWNINFWSSQFIGKTSSRWSRFAQSSMLRFPNFERWDICHF